MASQPLTGVNQQPLVFAQIRNGSSAPNVIKARIVTSSRVVDIKSNMFLHLFYSKPYMQDQGYNHSVDQAYGFQVKSDPDTRPFSDDIKAQSKLDVGDMKSEIISEREFLTLSELKTWEFKPSVRVADFFANSLGVPIDCWTPCSRIAIARELEAADLVKYELQCGAGESDACAMSAGELARSLHAGDQLSFGDVISGDCVEDLQGFVQLSILFVNENPDIQPLDFRMRMRILPCRCPPVIVKVPNSDGTVYEYYTAKLSSTYPDKVNENGSSVYKFEYVLDEKISDKDAACLGYTVDTFPWKYPVKGSIEEVRASSKADTDGHDLDAEGKNLVNMPKTHVLIGYKMGTADQEIGVMTLAELNHELQFKANDDLVDYAAEQLEDSIADVTSAVGAYPEELLKRAFALKYVLDPLMDGGKYHALNAVVEAASLGGVANLLTGASKTAAQLLEAAAADATAINEISATGIDIVGVHKQVHQLALETQTLSEEGAAAIANLASTGTNALADLTRINTEMEAKHQKGLKIYEGDGDGDGTNDGDGWAELAAAATAVQSAITASSAVITPLLTGAGLPADTIDIWKSEDMKDKDGWSITLESYNSPTINEPLLPRT